MQIKWKLTNLLIDSFLYVLSNIYMSVPIFKYLCDNMCIHKHWLLLIYMNDCWYNDVYSLIRCEANFQNIKFTSKNKINNNKYKICYCNRLTNKIHLNFSFLLFIQLFSNLILVKKRVTWVILLCFL